MRLLSTSLSWVSLIAPSLRGYNLSLAGHEILSNKVTIVGMSMPQKPKIFYGWWVLIAAVSLQILISTFMMQSFGAFLALIKEEFQWSKTDISSAFAVQQIVGGVLGPLVGWLLVRFGSRQVIRVGILIFAFSVYLLSRISSLQGFYLVVVLIAVSSSTAGFLPLNTLVVQWFEKRRSMALGLMQTGINAGGFLVPAVTWSLASNGWRLTAFAYAAIILIIGIPLTFVIKNKPEDIGLVADGLKDNKKISKVVLGNNLSAQEAVKTRAFWFIAFGHSSALMIVFAVMVHLVLYLKEDLGFSLEKAGTVFALITAFTIIGQLLGGYFGDRINKRLIASLAMIGHATGLVILVYAQNYYWVIAFSVFHGLAWGFRGPIMQAMRADYFGRKSFGQIMGYSMPILTIGIAFGPLIAGYLADKFGSYQIGFLVLAGLAVLGSLFFVFASPPKKRIA